MAKGLGLIGNFRGKFGNAVGYNLKDSNNKQTQGIRIYQPIVKNPKTYAQAEQRARLAPINATYRVLKPIIDRGQETKAYGSKSRLAWLKTAMKNFNGPWIRKGTAVTYPAAVPVSQGSLAVSADYGWRDGSLILGVSGLSAEGQITVAKLTNALLSTYPALQEGDQLTYVLVTGGDDAMRSRYDSIVLSKTDDQALPAGISVQGSNLTFSFSDFAGFAGTIIFSRLGSGGQHLRSDAVLVGDFNEEGMPYDDTAKENAVRSYMAGGVTSDWPQEPIKG